MTTWVKQLFSSTDKALDILNVGRMIFYTFSGLMAIYPATMIIMLLGNLEQAAKQSLFASMKNSIGLFDSWLLFFVSLVAGFVIAQFVFTVILTPIMESARRSLKDMPINKKSINYQYPSLRGEGDEDYHAWLIKEYFRYIEIGTILPLGFIVGLGLLDLYAVIYLLAGGRALSMYNIQSGIMFLLVMTMIIAVLVYYIWPYFWKPKVVKRTVEVYYRAKYHLLAGVEYFRSLNQASKSEET